MGNENAGSVTLWIGELKAGEGEAARVLWERYFATLVRLAADRLRFAPKTVADEEDVALSAFDSFCAAATAGRFPRLEDRDDLWRLLVTLTARKAASQANREKRQKRGGGRVIGEAALASPEGDGGGLDVFACPEPTPEFAASIADECRQRLEAMPDEAMRRIAVWRMEGYDNDEIADRLGCTRRTVSRKLELIRRHWSDEGPK